ncbi:MAG TPA: c-type cytochrome [Casimicrobiaceae bacterium]|nr:c-type cytochrome [Casimicrobiaceae bacterium]
MSAPDAQHTSFIKTPRQLAIVVAAAFAVPIVLIVLVSQLITSTRPAGSIESENKVLSRIEPVGQVTLADAAAPAGERTGEQVFQTVCKACHEAGLAGAPKVGDKAAWAPAIKKGYATLVKHAIEGFEEPGKVMPAKGGMPDLADIEVERAVVYMANQSGASFKEPVAPAAGASGAAAPAAAAKPATGAATAPSAPATKPAGPLDAKAAEAMMAKDGCVACHGVDKKIVGPAFFDVSAKYKGDAGALAKLTQKVKAGGSGVWGQIPMPPNSQVPDDDIKALVSWVLTLKK